MDNGLEDFVQKESPNQIMNLMLEEHVNNVISGEIFDSNDFENWMQCVWGHEEEKRNEQFATTTPKHVSNIFQLDISIHVVAKKLNIRTCA